MKVEQSEFWFSGVTVEEKESADASHKIRGPETSLNEAHVTVFEAEPEPVPEVQAPPVREEEVRKERTRFPPPTSRHPSHDRNKSVYTPTYAERDRGHGMFHIAKYLTLCGSLDGERVDRRRFKLPRRKFMPHFRLWRGQGLLRAVTAPEEKFPLHERDDAKDAPRRKAS